jgi:hypothetical protein
MYIGCRDFARFSFDMHRYNKNSTNCSDGISKFLGKHVFFEYRFNVPGDS